MPLKAIRLAILVLVWVQVSGLAIAQQDTDFDAYIIDDDVLIETSDGAILSALVVRQRGVAEPQPSALYFTIYTSSFENRRSIAIEAASRGYVGIVADTRGKRLSPDPIEPFKHEVNDTYEVIDWIAKQPWSNGEVGMYGGSYVGYAAWAATKRGHPALKTIVPSVADMRGLGLPMENNVFISANYAWPFYVMNNKFLDVATNNDRQRWNSLNDEWFLSGRPYREIDQVDGTPNPLLQEWLEHPAYDEYWQSMVPFGEEYARINIPVLSIAGYYDDGQVSSLQYLKEHYKYKPDAEHYLLIGPYDHFGTQRSTKSTDLRGYLIDSVAQFDTTELTFQWFDHIMRDGDRPELIEDKINFQVMGANVWQHAASIEEMSNEFLTFYLNDAKLGGHKFLSTTKPEYPVELEQTVDLADRSVQHHGYYPNPIIRDEIEVSTGFSFISEPFSEPLKINGSFSGTLNTLINKKDFDFQVVLYEILPNGSVMQLSYVIGRASFTDDMTTRRLLTPGEWESITFERSRMTSRQLSAGSRLLVVVDVIKDSFHQLNYGTGRDVSDESIADAEIPLELSWRSDSSIRIPIWRDEVD